MVMNGFETVIFEKKEGIGVVTLNRPESLNVYNMKMRDDLYEILSAIQSDGEIRVVLVKGSGPKAFCAGADLKEFLSAPSPTIARQVRFDRDIWGLFLSMAQPLIAAVHGYVFGSGLEIALCCDIRIASRDAVFALPEVGLGIIPAAGGTQTLPRVIGRAKALDMLLTGRRVEAAEAYDIGLVNRVVENTELYGYAEKLAKVICSHDQNAVRMAKCAVDQGLELSLVAGLELEKRLAVSLSERKKGMAK